MKKIMSLGFSPKAYIRVEPEWGKDDQIFVSMRANEEASPEYSVVLDAAGIKKLRKHLKKALEAIEGVDEEGERHYSVGDKVRLLEGGGHYPLNGYKNGNIYTIDELDGDWNGLTVKLTGGLIQQGYTRREDIDPA